MTLRVVFGLLAIISSALCHAEELMMARSTESFPETMLMLQDSLKEHGYTLSRVQRVDIGLTESGFKTDKYRVVFFGKPAELRDLSNRFPQLIPYLPLNMTLFAEGEETVVVAADPLMLKTLVPNPELSSIIERWRKDMFSIMKELRKAH
jgi:uncharacterized protein (DUF302 family)